VKVKRILIVLLIVLAGSFSYAGTQSAGKEITIEKKLVNISSYQRRRAEVDFYKDMYKKQTKHAAGLRKELAEVKANPIVVTKTVEVEKDCGSSNLFFGFIGLVIGLLL